MVFFFLKQKTAYEMRISDWSSDVCSSDLHVHALGRQLGAPLRQHARQVHRVEEPRLAALDLVEEAAEGPLAPLLDRLLPGRGQLAAEVARGVDDEIGGASARDRGCQYV